MSSAQPRSPPLSHPRPRMSLPPQARAPSSPSALHQQPASASPPPRVRSGSQPTTPTEGSYIPWHVRNPSPPKQAYEPHSAQPSPPATASAQQPPNRARFDPATHPSVAPYAYEPQQRQQADLSISQRPEPYRSSSMPISARHAAQHHHRTLSRTSSVASDSEDSLASGGDEWDEKRRRNRQARRLGKSLSEVAFEAVSEERTRKRERSRKVWKIVGWVTGLVLEGWVLWLMTRYFVAFLLFLDDSQRRKFTLAFFIVSLYSCLTTLPALAFLMPLFPSRRPSKLATLAHLLLILSSLAVLAIAALQIILFKLWEGEAAPRGFVGRCGWDMDAVWGAPTTCGTYKWDGWVGVLSARFAGSFILIAILHISILMFMLNSPRSVQLPTFPEESSEQSLIPTTLLDRHHPRLLSEDFEADRARRHRQSSNARSHRHASRKANHHRSDSNRYHDDSQSESEAMTERQRERTYTSQTYTGDEDRFQTGYLRPVDQERSRKPDYPTDTPFVDLSDSAVLTSQQAPSKGWYGSVPPLASAKPPSPPGAAVIARKPVRYTTSSTGHGGSGSEYYSDDGDVEDGYTPVFARSARTSTFGPTPTSTPPTTSPLQHTRSNLASPGNRLATTNAGRAAQPSHPLSPPRMTIPPPPDFSPELGSSSRFVPPSRPAPAPLAHAAAVPVCSPESPLDSKAYPFPPPPGSKTFPSDTVSYRAHTGQEGYTINPFQYDYDYPQEQEQPHQDGPARVRAEHAKGPVGVSPPPPREAPDLMLGSVWDDGEGEEAEDEFELVGRDAFGGRGSRVGGGEEGGARVMKRLSTIASETEREDSGRESR